MKTTRTPALATYPAMLREVHYAREQGSYEIAAELEALLVAPITVRGREYAPQESPHVMWWCHDDGPMRSRLFLHTIGWGVILSVVVDGIELTSQPDAQYPTPEAALDACAPARYPATALRAMGRALDALGVVEVDRVVPMRECTCLGQCRGADGLAEGWRCALSSTHRQCEICGERAQPMGTEPRCREHDNEKGFV